MGGGGGGGVVCQRGLVLRRNLSAVHRQQSSSPPPPPPRKTEKRGKTCKNVGKTWKNVNVEKRGKQWENVEKMWKTVGQTFENPANAEDLTIGACWNRLKRGADNAAFRSLKETLPTMLVLARSAAAKATARICVGGRATKSLGSNQNFYIPSNNRKVWACCGI